MSTENKSVAELAAETKAAFETQTNAVKAIAEEALGKAKAGETLTAGLKEQADEALTKLSELKERADQLEQKLARKVDEQNAEQKSFGAQFIESPEFKSFAGGGYRGNVRVELKEITAADGVARSQRETDIVAMPQRRMTVRDLLTVIPTTSASIDYVKQTTRTNAAATVAESAAKPYSDYVWTETNVPVRVIAHLAKVTRQALDDVVQLRGEIESEMRYGLRYTEEVQLLSGDGNAPNLNGLITQATAFSAPVNPPGTETMLDNIRLGLLQAELALYETDGIVLNPGDWALIELLKDSAGGYIFTNPQQTTQPRLWGKPVVSTPAMTVDKFLVGGFKEQRVYDRMQPEVLISSENVDDFEKNLYTMRCEERIALAVRRPGALIYGDFGNV